MSRRTRPGEPFSCRDSRWALARGGKLYRERAAGSASVVADAEGRSVGVGDAAADGQTQPRAPGFRGYEWVEDLIDELRGHSRSGVGNFDKEGVSTPLNTIAP